MSLGTILWALVLWSTFNMNQPIVRLMMPMDVAWRWDQAFIVWLMWAVMMAAMMLPSAYPMVMTYHRIGSRLGVKHRTWLFLSGYLVMWCAFSIGAALFQWGVQSVGLLTDMLMISDERAGAAMLILIGLSQWTRIKQLCLTICRTPIGFLATEWRDGFGGAFRMGLRHGAFCVGCCWPLMALLFVFGVMNLTAIMLLTAAVVAEKVLPYGDSLGRAGGAVLASWGSLKAIGFV